MFERVLLCYDGSVEGRQALKRGAELAILVKAKVFVLSIARRSLSDAVLAASAVGQICLIDPESEHRAFLEESIAWLKACGVEAEGHLVRGDTIDEIIAHSKRWSIDLVVVGHYPKRLGGRWWSGPERASLAEGLDCCLFIAVNETNAPSQRVANRQLGTLGGTSPHELESNLEIYHN
jgi:nucleotide-binding universal stress UspA family protein